MKRLADTYHFQPHEIKGVQRLHRQAEKNEDGEIEIGAAWEFLNKALKQLYPDKEVMNHYRPKRPMSFEDTLEWLSTQAFNAELVVSDDQKKLRAMARQWG